MSHIQHPMRGFTLVETLVAISIIMLAIVGPFTSVEHALTASYTARDQLVASSLAQEGIEYVRGIRDGNAIGNIAPGGTLRHWLAGLDGTPGATASFANCFTAPCVVDPAANTVSATIAPLNLRTSGSQSYLYNQAAVSSTNAATRFTRTVQLQTVPSGQNPTVTTEVKVTVTVSWITSHVPYSVVLTENLQPWI